MTRNRTILNDFEQFLKKQSVVRPNQQPYYIRWGQMYIDANTSLDGLGKSVTVKQFVNDLTSENGFTDWQVKQAMDAILPSYCTWEGRLACHLAAERIKESLSCRSA